MAHSINVAFNQRFEEDGASFKEAFLGIIRGLCHVYKNFCLAVCIAYNVETLDEQLGNKFLIFIVTSLTAHPKFLHTFNPQNPLRPSTARN